MADFGRETLLSQLYQHAVLPRHVPGREDKNLYRVESELLRRLSSAVKSLVPHTPLEDLADIDAVRLALTTCSTLNVDGKIDRTMLIKEMRQLVSNQGLILHVTEQNAALLVYLHVSDDGTKSVVFETFETSATCESVLATENALQWDFPGQVVAVPYDTYSNDDFQQSLSTFLEQASIESIKQFAAVTYKACAPLPEIRDTPNPTLVTGALMTILEVSGSTINIPLLRKRVRDTVSFDQAHKPWRRSAFYLVLRVALQRHLYRILGPDKGRLYYKVIMCIFLSQLLDAGVYVISNEASHFLRQKLGRRLAKLEVDHDRGSQTFKDLHRHIFRTFRPRMEKSLSFVAQFIDSQWEAHKRRTSRIVRPIQQRANPSDMKLPLLCSGQYLRRAMYLRFSTAHSVIGSPTELLGQYESTTALKPFTTVMERYLSLCAYEEDVPKILESAEDLSDSAACIRIARKIEAYVDTVNDAYVDYPEFKSRQLLHLLCLWMAMDRCTVNCYPLLGEYHPGFDPAMLAVLHLSTLDDLDRLHDLQLYLHKRCSGWRGTGAKTIFDTPAEDSFAVRYYKESKEATSLIELRNEIEEDAEENLAAKEAEWQEKSEIHEAKIREMVALSCIYKWEKDENGIETQVHQKPCRKHTLKWQAKQMTIDILEHPLPKAEPALRAVIFELMCPKDFAAYRDATWLILSSYAFPKPTPIDNVPLLRSYSGLRDYANRVKTKVTLGSTTKSHLESHYAKSGFPVTFREVCRSFGLKLDYFDETTSTFASKQEQPSFAHLFPLKLHSNSPYVSFEDLNKGWPTSNRVLATQTACPPDLNVHEYMAWQGLLVGTHSRWPCLLREMGSTNLSFSTDSTWAIVSHLLLQAGPTHTDDPLRDIHSILRDGTFCRQLLAQVDYRLEAIKRNWREPVQLDILMSMLLKIISVTPSARIRTIAADLLSKSRIVTQGWCKALQGVEHEHGSGQSIFPIWAAVLCKRTFYPTIETSHKIQPHLLTDFIVASITLQNCLVGQFDTLPYNLRNAILRDLASSYDIRARMEDAMRTNENALLEALRIFWPVPANSMESRVTMYDPNSWWVAISLSTHDAMEYHVHYNFVIGTLLINGQQLGILPPEYRHWPIIQKLFGSQSLSVLPSSLPGMSLVIHRVMPFEHWVHLGFRDKGLVIRAQNQRTILELIPTTIFGNERNHDLPSPLVLGCYHWLDLSTGMIEIRQQDPWKSKRSNWRLNLTTGQAIRNNGSTLVNPNSDLAKRVIQNFHLFELPHHITVYQPPHDKLRVELKRLELDFVVVQGGLLLCPQLDAVIAESQLQDVGTWYGLKSKLVVRSIKDHTQRSILLPLGKPIIKAEGPHVSIVIENHGEYLRFGVNNVLGRIDCPAEPIMLYHRALWHALTAHFLPDPLTKRTGVEQALQYLRSGAYRPWTPLTPDACNLLLMMAKLSPTRVYYPATLKAMESVHWNSDLPITMQDDRYRRAVEHILNRNTEIALFAPRDAAQHSSSSMIGNVHLENRALSRTASHVFGPDKVYKSRDRRLTDSARNNAADIARLIHEWPSKVSNTRQLAALFENIPIISGYARLFDKVQMTDILYTDIGLEWGALVQTALKFSHNERFQAMFLFSFLAFSSTADLDLLRAIVSFSLLPSLKEIALPDAAAYSHFKLHEVPGVDSLMSPMRVAMRPCVTDQNIPTAQLLMRQLDHERNAERACRAFAESIQAQWPSRVLDLHQLVNVKDTLLDREAALNLVLPLWGRFVDNLAFSQHLEELQLVLSRHNTDSTIAKHSPKPLDTIQSRLYPLRMRGGELPTLQEILSKDISSLNLGATDCRDATTEVLRSLPNGYHKNVSEKTPSIITSVARQKQTVSPQVKELIKIIAPFRASQSMVHKRYGSELEQSIKALSDHLAKPEPLQEPFNPTKLSNDVFAAKEQVHQILEQIRHALQNGDTRARWLYAVGMWPDTTPLGLLTELRSTSGVVQGPGIKETLVKFGLAITKYQRLLRLRDAHQKNRKQQVLDESDNIGHTNWSPLEYADWLLLEIESNIMIRPEQVDVALGTIAPHTHQNSVLQLLMGKGKTSCILPMVALVLTKKNLFRIVVPRPLLLQSAQIMQAKLGGILNREVVHIPFSRKTPTGKDLMQTYCQMHTYIQKQSGIILALPEHLLSFKLSGLQRLCDGKIDEAGVMIKAQTWLDRHARDVLDECDVSLAIRTQLIYPSGSQQTVDGHPLRWQTIQALLDLITSYLDELMRRYPNSIEVVGRSGFPFVYFLRKDAEDYLMEQMVQKICRGQTIILPVSSYSASLQEDIREFISTPLVDVEVTKRVLAMFSEKRHLVDVLYHLRGLFVHRILLSTLKKRWNVQYGLHPIRDPIAVPYQAKGVPSPTAEWGHPDVAIIITCLSFYYEGLSMAQFKQAIEHLAKADEPSIEYSLWVAEGVPEGFKNYNAVNVEDVQQIRELHHHVRYKVCLLDFYLNSFVFPKHAKQFSKKLSASGSDLVLYDPVNPSCRVSGFSGTNDARHQLPLTIKQNDLPQLAHTNAEVLVYLLEDRNRDYVRMVDVQNKRLSEDGLLKKLANPYSSRGRIRILIDAGAQILEYDNRSLVKAWLKEDHKAVAAVYFDEEHRARVVYGKGTDIPLVASPFAENLEKCLVYLDESHCRGTDLKLPPYARAAVTLGPHLTKDALVQATMRLRLLGKTQSVSFFSPPEVHQSILDLRAAAKGWPQVLLSSVDVVRWLLEQTCNGIEQLEPLYFNQGLNYLQRTQAKLGFPDFLEDAGSRKAYLNVVRSKELQSLQQLYEPKYQQRGTPIKVSSFEPCLRTHVSEILQRRKGFQDRGFAIHASALEEVEQEREMEFEVEAVREVQDPVHFRALKVAKLHPDIETLATTGRMPAGSNAFQPMFHALQKTAIGMRHGAITATGSAARLYVSTQFTRTVSVNEPNDNFLRPCQWVLWSRTNEIGLLVSPEEANALIPILRNAYGGESMCHLMVYSAPITRRMLQFNGLDYYAIPPLPKLFQAPKWLKVELGIFAGRLYFEWDEYEEILSYLGIQLPREGGDHSEQFALKKAFATKPLTFLHEWLAVRRKGQDFEHTPMGFVTTGKPLFVDHPFFSASNKNEDSETNVPSTARRILQNEDDDDGSDDGEDHAKEHFFQYDGDDEGHEVFHDAEEDLGEFDDKENTFFDGGAYVDVEEEPKLET